MKFFLWFFLFWLSSCGTELIDTPDNSSTTSKKDAQEPTPVVTEVNSKTPTHTNDDPVKTPTPILAKPYCQVKEILTNNCIACHASRQPRLGSENIRETLSNNNLVDKIYEEIDSGSMPRGKNRLDQKSIDLIESWMNAGEDTSATCP